MYILSYKYNLAPGKKSQTNPKQLYPKNNHFFKWVCGSPGLSAPIWGENADFWGHVDICIYLENLHQMVGLG